MVRALQPTWHAALQHHCRAPLHAVLQHSSTQHSSCNSNKAATNYGLYNTPFTHAAGCWREWDTLHLQLRHHYVTTERRYPPYIQIAAKFTRCAGESKWRIAINIGGTSSVTFLPPWPLNGDKETMTPRGICSLFDSYSLAQRGPHNVGRVWERRESLAYCWESLAYCWERLAYCLESLA